MSEWQEPGQRLVECSEPWVTGRGLGVISRKYFKPVTWEPLLSTEVGRGQFSKFVTVMVERILLKESNYDELQDFIDLVANQHNCDFTTVALPRLPELNDFPQDGKSLQLAVLSLLKSKLSRRSTKKIEDALPASRTYENGLSKAEEHLLWRRLFGPDTGAAISPSMNRIFKSTLELGYPQPALDQLMREAKERGTDVERDCDGLPTFLRMPKADQFSSSSHNHGASSSGIGNPDDAHARSSVIPSSSATGAKNAPRAITLSELLTELVIIDGTLDPPVHGLTPNEIRIKDPNGQEPEIPPKSDSNIEDTLAILSAQAGPSNE